MESEHLLATPPYVLSGFSDSPVESVRPQGSYWLLYEVEEVLMGGADDFGDAIARVENGGEWFGFLGYELGEITEAIEPRGGCSWGLPDFWFARFSSRRRIELETPPITIPPSTEWMANLSPTEYHERLHTIRRYLEEGDIYQANLSVQFEAEAETDPLALFLRLAERSQASHSCYLDAGDWKILSVSPELFLHIDQSSIVTRPIKGTIGKTGDAQKDRQSLEWLLSSPKDLAELLMIVDLERNDLGRLCEYGSVRVDRFPEVLELPNLYHLLATVRGKLRDPLSLNEIISATFPGGSISGAPKRRALEVIRELEPHRRGPYCGAIGFLSRDKVHFNLAIRTAVWNDNRLRFWGGGGIVIDHDPESEREEILTKLNPFLDILGVDPEHFW